ncbi:hypothetical protein FRB99_004014 [Tulasnella sp. 403]|nr:hypothetical protein FRB99_004014 [Tulasnella sp. 403]
MAAGAAGPGLFFCFVAFVLLLIVTLSAPIWNDISFLNAIIGGREIHFGVFGYTGSPKKLGYPLDQLNVNGGLFTNGTIHNLTYVLVLHPIAAGLSFLAVLFGLCGAAYHRSGTILMSIATAVAAVVTLVAWVVDMVLFGITRNHLRGQGYPAQYGNANWMTLGALVALLLGFCTSICGIFGRYRMRRTEKY